MKTNFEALAKRAEQAGFKVERHADGTFTITLERVNAEDMRDLTKTWERVDHGPVDLDEYHERQRQIAILLARYAAWANEHKKMCTESASAPCSCGLSELETELQKHPSVRALAEALQREQP